MNIIDIAKNVFEIEAKEILHLSDNLGFTAYPNDIQEVQNIFKKSIDLTLQEKEIFTQNCQKLTDTIFNKEKIIDRLEDLILGSKG